MASPPEAPRRLPEAQTPEFVNPFDPKRLLLQIILPLKKGTLHIALVGNPNSGKSSLFNALTGLNQKVGNFPGVTVDKKTGVSKISEALTAHIIDLPGTYSLYPKRHDEWVAYKVLLEQDPKIKADVIVL